MLLIGSQQGNWEEAAAWPTVGSSQEQLWLLWSAGAVRAEVYRKEMQGRTEPACSQGETIL